MPRSFLVKKYYPWNDGQILNSLTEWSEKCNQQKSQNPIKFQKSEWDYELEKSYWFDTAENSLNSLQNEEKICDKKRAIDENETTVDATSLYPVKSKNESTEGKSFKQFIEKVIPNSLSAYVENEELAKVTTTHEKEPLNEVREKENFEFRLDEMLDEDLDVMTKSIRQFLDNNRLILDEVADEIGLDRNELKTFMDVQGKLSEEEKREFYRWYLLKIIKGPRMLSDDSYTCHKCGKIFTYKSYLERHIKYVCPDSTGRTWKCEYCGKAFQYPCYLRRHVRSHTGESPYKCDKCERAFVRSTDLQRHIRNHTGEKPYCCSQCSRAFARSTDLKRHMRTHTGEKPYKCWQCGKSFSQSGSLQTHLNTHKVYTAGRKQLS